MFNFNNISMKTAGIKNPAISSRISFGKVEWLNGDIVTISPESRKHDYEILSALLEKDIESGEYKNIKSFLRDGADSEIARRNPIVGDLFKVQTAFKEDYSVGAHVQQVIKNLMSDPKFKQMTTEEKILLLETALLHDSNKRGCIIYWGDDSEHNPGIKGYESKIFKLEDLVDDIENFDPDKPILKEGPVLERFKQELAKDGLGDKVNRMIADTIKFRQTYGKDKDGNQLPGHVTLKNSTHPQTSADLTASKFKAKKGSNFEKLLFLIKNHQAVGDFVYSAQSAIRDGRDEETTLNKGKKDLKTFAKDNADLFKGMSELQVRSLVKMLHVFNEADARACSLDPNEAGQIREYCEDKRYLPGFFKSLEDMAVNIHNGQEP